MMVANQLELEGRDRAINNLRSSLQMSQKLICWKCLKDGHIARNCLGKDWHFLGQLRFELVFKRTRNTLIYCPMLESSPRINLKKGKLRRKVLDTERQT